MRKAIADLHCHPSLKPANNSKLPDIWTYKRNITTKSVFKGLFGTGISLRKWAVNLFVRDMATYTQTNLDSCYDGDNRLLFLAIYPPERPFLKPDRPFKNASDAQCLLLKVVFGKKLKRKVDNKIIRVLTGFSSSRIKEYLKSIYDSDVVNYFDDDYKKEYDYIKKSHLSTSTNDQYVNKPSFKLVKNYEEYQKVQGPSEIAGILTVEGMHAIANYKNSDLFEKSTIDDLDANDRIALQNSFKNNIKKLKDPQIFEFPPFFITFSHHFNNLISGHAKSFADSPNKTIPGFSNVFNQSNGLNLGITDFGKVLIEDHLLSRDNGNRILIDTKHMSLASRDDYITIVREYWKRGDKVPIIISHTAINGIPTRQEAARRPDTNKAEKKSYISRWDINLTDQDIEEVFETEGIIGICMHDGRMPGGKFKKLLKGLKRGIVQDEPIKRLHAQMFLTNIFHVVKVNLQYIRKLNAQNPGSNIPETRAWDTVSLGTDSDGIVDPFDHFNTADTLDDFKLRISKAIKLNFKPYMKKFRIISIASNSSRFFDQNELTDLMLGFTPEEIADLVFSDNLVSFLKTYFTKTYLEG